MADRPRLVIIGGGLSGLAAAFELTRNPGGADLEVRLLESRDRVGGAIWTHRRDGFTIEGGADSFITDKPGGIELCRDLGLEEKLITPSSAYRRSFVIHRGRLQPIPDGFVLMTPRQLGPLLRSPILSPWGKLRALFDLVLPARPVGENQDESLASFARRRLGKQLFERLVQPLVGGIYTGDPLELSLKATLPRFLEMERQHGSLIRAGLAQAAEARRRQREQTDAGPQTKHESGARYGLFASLRDGMDGLPRALEAALPKGTLSKCTSVRRLSRPETGDCSGPARWRIELRDGPTLQADAVLLATEAHTTARLVDGFDSQLAHALREIPYASSAIVTLGWRREQIAHPLDGFGMVIPRIEGRELLATSFLSVKFPDRAPQGSVLLRSFLGGSLHPDVFNRTDSELVALVRRELVELLGATGEPQICQVDRHPRAVPQYTLGHLDRVATIKSLTEAHRSLGLIGSAFGGVGIPDCISSARRIARDLALALLKARDAQTAA